MEIADKCNFDFEIGAEKYPKYEPTQDVIDYFKTDNVEEIGRKLAFQKLKQKLDRYKQTGEVEMTEEKVKEYVDRLNYELEVICDKKVLDYFLVNWEILRDYRSHGYDVGVGRGCFVPNSRVKMGDDNYKNIQDIKIGEIVIDALGNKRNVINTLQYDVNEELVELVFDNGVKIKCTQEHEFLTKNREWVKAIALDINDDVCDLNVGVVKLINKETIKYCGKVHDLTIEESHSYNIEGVSVHNSAAGCLLSWAIDIIGVDPIVHGLYFERFLNPARKGNPDLDLDFMTDSQHITEDFLIKKYGRDRILHVSTFSKFNEKGCLKDVVKAHQGEGATGFDSVAFQITKEMPDWSKVDYTLEDWFKQWPLEKECSEPVKKWLLDPRNKKILDQTLKLQGQIRGIGQHAAGVVITPTSNWNDIPTNIIPKEKSIVTAFSEADGSSKDLSELGILKLDMLKLTTLNVVKEASDLVLKHKEKDISNTLKHLDLGDENLYSELRLGFNHGIFQFESSGMNSLIKGIKVNGFNELVATNALFRPGPMGINAHGQFIENKFNPEKITYIHPILEEILGETNGVMIYQEQVMFIANKIGGLSLGEGDLLRRYMDKAAKYIEKEARGETLTQEDLNSKAYKIFKETWDKFLEGAKKNGYSEDVVNEIKNWMIKYLGYSFNKCLTSNHIVESKLKGKVKIDKVNIGDEILCYNPKIKQNEYRKIKDIHHNGVKKVFKITTESNKILECTIDHKIMTPVGMKTLEECLIRKLKINVLDSFETPFFEHIGYNTYLGEIDTMDLEIDSEFHNFYANGICVSNSHCVCYSYIACQTLFLKHYYPTEFYTALLNHPKNGSGSDAKEKERQWLASTIAAAMSKGIIIRPPSKKSGWNWTMTGDKEISIGFSGINGFGDIAYNELINLLSRSSETLETVKAHTFFSLPFSAFNKKTFESCVKAGVFDDWSDSREYLNELKAKKKKKEIPGQMALFDLNSDVFSVSLNSSSHTPTTLEQKKKEFIEVCNFDLDKIEEVVEIKNQLLKQTGMIIESILNFDENGYYFFYLENIQVATSDKGSEYLVLKVGDGISSMSLRLFQPRKKTDGDMYDYIKTQGVIKGLYITEFVKNAKGFTNFKSGAKIKRIK